MRLHKHLARNERLDSSNGMHYTGGKNTEKSSALI